jgi:hypothetical protein
MSLQGIILIDILGFGLIVLIVNLVRTHRLYVGFALIWLSAIVLLMVIISFSPLLMLVTKAVGALFPVSALTLLAFVFIFLVLIFITVQLSMLSTRQVELMQSIALKDLLERKEGAGKKGLKAQPQTGGTL